MSRVQEVFSQVAAEHPLPEDAPLLQLLLGGPGLHEGAQEGDQLPVFFRYWEGGAEKVDMLEFSQIYQCYEGPEKLIPLNSANACCHKVHCGLRVFTHGRTYSFLHEDQSPTFHPSQLSTNTSCLTGRPEAS